MINKSLETAAITVAILLTVGLPHACLEAKEFSGRVTDEFDQPIYGALVAVRPAGDEEGNAESLHMPVLTDGQGKFTVELPNDPSSPHVTIWALADGYNLAAVLANTNVVDTEIHLTASSTIRCSVALPHYEPAAGVGLQVHRFQFERTVAVVPSVFRLRLEQKTDGDGNAVLRQLSLSNVRSLIAKSESYGDQILRIEEYIDASKPQLLFLAPAATLKVFVDSKHPQNLLGRRGKVRSEAGNGASTEHEFALDAEGSFFLPYIAEGKASLTWIDWPSMAMEWPLVPPIQVSGSTDIHVPLVPTIPVRARLVDRGNQLPIVGADVMLSVDNNSSSFQKVKTDMDGHLSARMPPGKLTITANRMSENELVICNFHPNTFALKPAANSLDLGAISVQLLRIQ